MSATILAFPVPENVDQLSSLASIYFDQVEETQKREIVSAIREGLETTLREQFADLRSALYTWFESGDNLRPVFENELRKYKVQVNIAQHVTNVHIHQGEIVTENKEPKLISRLASYYLSLSLEVLITKTARSADLSQDQKINTVGHAIQLMPELLLSHHSIIFSSVLDITPVDKDKIRKLLDGSWKTDDDMPKGDYASLEVFDHTFNQRQHMSPKVIEEVVKATAKAEPQEAWAVLERYNANFAIVQNFGNQVRILSVSSHDMCMSSRSFIEGRTNEKVCLGFDDKTGAPEFANAAMWWFNHEKAKRYEKPLFRPGVTAQTSEYFNLWRGEIHKEDYSRITYDPTSNRWVALGGRPIETTCLTVCRFLRNIICCGNDKFYNYLLDWIADIIQNPMSEQNITIILFSKLEGMGKGTLFSILRWLVGRDYASIVSTSEDLAGGFNSMLLNKLLFMIDEAALADDKKARKAVRSIQGGDSLRIERKGVDAFDADNFIRLMNATNEVDDIRFPASDRRHVVYELKEAAVLAEVSSWKGRPVKSLADCPEYFIQVKKLVTEGPEGAALYTMLKLRDISGWNRIADRPRDRFYFKRQFASLPRTVQAFANILSTGRIRPVADVDISGWKVTIDDRLVEMATGETAYAFYPSDFIEAIEELDSELKLSVQRVKKDIESILLNAKKLGPRPYVYGVKATKDVIWLPSLKTTRKLFEASILNNAAHEWDEDNVAWGS